jgi:hypothetical protein
VLRIDLRNHGASGQSQHGRHVARLAVDLRDVLVALQVGPGGVGKGGGGQGGDGLTVLWVAHTGCWPPAATGGPLCVRGEG